MAVRYVKAGISEDAAAMAGRKVRDTVSGILGHKAQADLRVLRYEIAS